MDDYQVEALAVELSKIKKELRLANALKFLEIEGSLPLTRKEAELGIDWALKNIKENYGE